MEREYLTTYGSWVETAKMMVNRRITDSWLTHRTRQAGGYLIIHVRLPLKIPFNDGFRYVWGQREARFLEITHYSEEYPPPIIEPYLESEAPDSELPPLENSYSVVRFGRPLHLTYAQMLAGSSEPLQTENSGNNSLADRTDVPGAVETLSDLIDEGLVVLNLLIRACRVETNELSLQTIDNLARLPPAVLYSIWDVTTAMNLIFTDGFPERTDVSMLGGGVFVLHGENLTFPEDASPPQTARIVELASQSLHGYPHPFFGSADLIRSANSKLGSGENNAAIVEAVTAVETFVSTLLRLQMEGAGATKENIDNILEAGFKNLLRDHLARKLAITFDLDNPTNALETWFTSAYASRNQIVHHGLIADVNQARRALAETDDLLTYLVERVKKHETTFHKVIPFITKEAEL